MYYFKSDFPRKSEASTEKILFYVLNLPIHVQRKTCQNISLIQEHIYRVSILKFYFLESKASNEDILLLVYFHEITLTSDYIPFYHILCTLYGEIRNNPSIFIYLLYSILLLDQSYVCT